MQTSYSINTPSVSFPGQPADLGTKDVTSALAVAAAIPYGVLAVRDGSNTSGASIAAKVPAAATDITVVGSALGVVLADQARAQDPSVAVAVIPQNAAASCMRIGRVWVLVEQTVVAGDLPFVRFATSVNTPALVQKGAFRKDADTNSSVDTAALLPNAVFVVGASSGGYAMVEVTLA